MRRFPPLHPIFLALLPVLSLYSHYLGAYEWAEIQPSALVAVGVGAVAILPGLILFRNLRKAAILATVALAGGLFYVRLFDTMGGTPVIGPLLAHHRIALPLYLFVVLGTAWWLWRTKRRLDVVTPLANVITLGMLLLPAGQLAWFFATHRVESPDPAAAVAADPNLASATRPAQPPDIWYIILDRYGSQATLQDVCGDDNQEFYDYLTARGFFVAQESFSNYPRTPLSLASSLNFEYLDEVAAKAGEDSPDWRWVYERIRHHKVGAFLRSQGYRRIHSGSWWWPTREDPRADENLAYGAPPYGALVLTELSVLAALRLQFNLELADQDLQQYNRLQYKFARLGELPRQQSPKFVFAHVIAPHPPYVMRADGSYRDWREVASHSEEALYCDQLLAVNRLVRGLLDRILAESAVPPIILLQSDEGPWFKSLGRPGIDFTPETITPRQLKIKSGILNAYHLPGIDPDALYPDITPVNSFRLVFSHYFGARLEPLPDRVLSYESESRPYRFKDVTARVRQK